MEQALTRSAVCPVLIGRAPSLEILDQLLSRAQSGAGSMALVSGEAGIGKSRLVAEMKSRAAAQGVPVLEGDCFDFDRSLPYAPLLDLLRNVLSALTPQEAQAAFASTAPELIKLLPELALTLPEITATPPLPPEQERDRLFHALAQFFAHYTDALSMPPNSPLLVILEDLHWSDENTLDYIHHWARQLETRPVLLLLTFRSDEIHPALMHLLAELDRSRRASEVQLKRLSRAEVEAMVRAIFEMQRPVRAEFLDALYDLTEGNPFSVEEILKGLIASGDIFYTESGWDRKPIHELHIPRSVQDAVQRRARDLTPSTRELLALAAVAGRRFDVALLRELTGLGESDLVRAIKELIDAQLVVEESGDEFAFRHALTREAVYATLLVRERRALHLRIAESLEHLRADSADSNLADLAYHFYQAEAWGKALGYSQRMGEKALRLFAPRIAADHFTRALDSARQLDVVPSTSLYRSRGQAYEALGDFPAARADYERELETSREIPDRAAESQALIDLGFLWAGRDYEQTGKYFRAASELTAGLDDPLLHARSLNRFGNWLANTGRTGESVETHRTALQIFESVGDKHGTAETLDLLGFATGYDGDVIGAVELIGRAAGLFRALDDQPGLASALGMQSFYASPSLASATYTVGWTLEEYQRQEEEVLQLSRQIGAPSGITFILLIATDGLVAYGELGRAMRYALEGLELATDIQHQQWMAAMHSLVGLVHYILLDAKPAIQHLEAALPLARAVGSAWWSGIIVARLARAYLLNNQLAQAAEVLRSELPEEQRPSNYWERQIRWAWGELHLARGEPAKALAVAEELIESAQGVPPPQGIPALLKLRGEALRALKRTDEAEVALKDAAQGAAKLEARPLLWQIHRSLGDLYRATSRPDKAASQYAAARSIIADLASSLGDTALAAGFIERAQATLPTEKPHPSSRPAKPELGGLSPRELEVAAHIAQGESNRAIAASLVVTERTVESHVGSILSKLGFTSRAQIAAWAVENHLRS